MNPDNPPLRFDYAYPLHVASGHRQLQRANYPDHVAQMVRQVLLTAQGERVCMPDFGCGLRQLVFQPQSAGLPASTELLVRRALETYLSGHIRVDAVKVPDISDSGNGGLEIRIAYTLLETHTADSISLQVR
jgi:phage baseplate assembly protein W